MKNIKLYYSQYKLFSINVCRYKTVKLLLWYIHGSTKNMEIYHTSTGDNTNLFFFSKFILKKPWKGWEHGKLKQLLGGEFWIIHSLETQIYRWFQKLIKFSVMQTLDRKSKFKFIILVVKKNLFEIIFIFWNNCNGHELDLKLKKLIDWNTKSRNME
jgi:hypothetical protein